MLTLIPIGHAKVAATDVTTCEACWRQPVTTIRSTPGARDLLCDTCAAEGNPVRVLLFPPFGIYRLTERMVEVGKHGKPTPLWSCAVPPGLEWCTACAIRAWPLRGVGARP